MSAGMARAQAIIGRPRTTGRVIRFLLPEILSGFITQTLIGIIMAEAKTCPALTQSTINWANHGAVILQSPENAEAENVYQDEPFNVFAILKKADVAKGEFLVNLQGRETLNQQMLSFDIKIDAANAVKGEELFQLAARKCIEI